MTDGSSALALSYETPTRQSLRTTGQSRSSRAVRNLEWGYVKHPKYIWVDEDYADEPLPRLVDEYLRWVAGRAERISAQTVAKYRASLKGFLVSIAQSGEPLTLASVTPAAGDRWVAEQRDRDQAEEGIASRQAAVKVFTRKYVQRELELTRTDLLERWKRVKAPVDGKEGLSPGDLKTLTEDVFDGGHNGLRDRALVMVYVSTGLRFCEVLGMTVDGLDRVTGEFAVVAKGNKPRTVRMSAGALKSVKRWMRERERSVQADCTALWSTDEGTALTYWGAQSVFRRMKRKAGMPRLHAHLLRHTFGQGAIKMGADRALVQDMLGHETDSMTRRYTRAIRAADAAAKMPQFALV